MPVPTDAAGWRGLYDALLAEENAIGFASFSYEDAWALGSAMVDAATDGALPLAIGINFGEQRVFHAALRGSSATQDDWLDRKFNAVAKHNCSSYALKCKTKVQHWDYFADGGYRPAEIALAGGAIPLRVNGSLIGAVGVSGLAEADDHRFVIDALKAHRSRPET